MIDSLTKPILSLLDDSKLHSKELFDSSSECFPDDSALVPSNQVFVRRLYSSFAGGLPGAGLLIMRLVAGTVLVAHGGQGLLGEISPATTVALVATIGLGLLIIAGLWTPVAGVLVAILEIGWLVWSFGDPWMHLFVATLGISLALLGPGAWSVDCRLFGSRRININTRRS